VAYLRIFFTTFILTYAGRVSQRKNGGNDGNGSEILVREMGVLVLFVYTLPVFFLTGLQAHCRLRGTVIENRKNQRFELRLPFEVIRSGHRFSFVQGTTLNMSSSGVLFELSEPLPVGEIIEYFITLPTGQNPDEDVRLRCMGKVIRSHENFAAATMERYEFVRTRPSNTEASVASAS
jgi:hypothetical protein